MITELLLDVDARSGRLGEELDVFLAEHAGHSKVLDQDLHDLACVFHHRRVSGTGVEHAARHTTGQGLGCHKIHVAVVDHREPDPEQKRDQLLVPSGQSCEESEIHTLHQQIQETFSNRKSLISLSFYSTGSSNLLY